MNQEQIMQQLQGAVALHNQGELDKAEEICRKVLAVDANNFMHLISLDVYSVRKKTLMKL